MRRVLILKVAVVLASIGTGLLIGRAIIIRAGEPGRSIAQRKQVAKNYFARGNTNRIDFAHDEPGDRVSPKPGVLVVQAEAPITNQWETQHFWWYMKVVRHTRPIIVEREIFYQDQAFVIPHGAVVSPRFHEEIPLPPGRYQVMLQLRSSRDMRNRDGSLYMANFPIVSNVLYQTVSWP